jgi:hypothetical protein
MAGTRARRASSISPHEQYLWERWTQGCQNAYVLWQEIHARGFRGSYVHLRRALRGWRAEPGRRGRRVQPEGPPPSSSLPALRPFSARQATWLVPARRRQPAAWRTALRGPAQVRMARG